MLTHVGCHTSIRNGYAGAARTALAIGATAFQYFPKNPRGLSVKRFNEEDAAECARICQQHGIVSVAHTTYATNLAAEGPLREATILSLRNDLDIAEACGSEGVVVHFGKWKDKGEPLAGYKLILSALNDTLKGWNGRAMLFIENQAGEGQGIGTSFDELVSIRSLSDEPEKIGFCLDTCHLFASGYWNGANWSELLRNGRSLGFFQHLKALHLNDSVFPSGSRRDRHASIGAGCIGEAAIKDLLQTEELHVLPIVLETPIPSGTSSHRVEIGYVRKLGE